MSRQLAGSGAAPGRKAPAIEGDFGFQAHIYEGNRCLFCNVNDLDESMYGPFDCVVRGQYAYTSETPNAAERALPRQPPEVERL